MKTIMILIDQFYLHGGIEKLVGIKANYWSDRFGYDIIIVSTEQQNKKKVYALSDQIKFIDLNINYQRGISFFHPKNLNKLSLNFRKIKDLITTYEPDFILVASHIPMTYLLPFVNTKAKIIKEFHYSKFDRRQGKKEKFFAKIERKYDFLAVLSEEEKKFYASDNVVIIPNPIEITSRIDTGSLKNKSKIAAAILRFAPVKQIDKMVEIWEIFHQNNKDWQFYIYGDTNEEYYKGIKKLVDEKKLNDTIIFKGKTNNVYKALEEVSLLLMTSANECFPMVILEANSCGVPVISFDSPTGPRNIIKHNVDGLIVPLNNIDIFAEQLGRIANDPEKLYQMSFNAIENSRQYSLDKVMELWKNEIFEK